MTDGNLGKYMGDLITSWWLFLVMAGISTVISIIYILLLRVIAKPLLYISFILIFALLVGGGFYVFFLSYRYDSSDHTNKVMKGMGILIWILAGLYTIILLCCWKAI